LTLDELTSDFSITCLIIKSVIMDVAQNIQPDSFNNILVRDSYGNFSFFDIGLLEWLVAKRIAEGLMTEQSKV